MLKRVFLAVLTAALLTVLAYGCIVVYTHSYNVLNRGHITAFDVEYSPKEGAVYLTIIGREYRLSL